MKAIIILALFLLPAIATASEHHCIDLGFPRVTEIERNSTYVRYSIQIDAENECSTDTKVFVTLSGQAFGGKELESVILIKNINKGEREEMTDTTLVSPQDAMNIRDWEVKEVAAYKR